jgi:hypothetical protein
VVEILIHSLLPAGSHHFTRLADAHASGIYFYYYLKAGNFQAVRKMILLR